MQDLEQESCVQDLVLQRSCNKDSVEISKVENEFLQKNLEDLYTILKKNTNKITKAKTNPQEQQKKNNGRRKKTEKWKNNR